MSLKSKIALRLVLAALVFGVLLFIPAGTLKFWQGWAYLVVFLVPGLTAFVYFYECDPELIERRLRFKEKVHEQKRIMMSVYVTWLIAFSLPGLDHRFGWSHMPLYLAMASQVLVCGVAADAVGREGQPFRFADDSGRARSEGDFNWALWHRRPSYVLGRLGNVVVHALGTRLVFCLACFCSPSPVNRSPPPQRGKGSSPRTSRLS